MKEGPQDACPLLGRSTGQCPGNRIEEEEGPLGWSETNPQLGCPKTSSENRFSLLTLMQRNNQRRETFAIYLAYPCGKPRQAGLGATD